jgi:acetate kinase
LLVGQIENLGREPVMRARRGEVEFHDAFDGASGHAPPADHAQALAWLVAWLDRHSTGHRIVAVGHRVVHGGLHHHEPIVVDDAAVERLRTLCPLAPLHQPHNLAGIDAARAAFGAVPQVACFDTAFHRAQPFVADCFALPRELYHEGVRRYGFHGLSYESITHHLQRSFPLHAAGRVIVAHLGSGASMCAMREGRSIASTMGFSALDGLPMGTRCGQVDPGVVLYLMEHKGLDAAAITDVLYRRSGLLGLSGGLSNDMRTLEASKAPEAGEAIDYFVFRIRREMGGLAASLEGLDAVVFTGGIGENSVLVRSRVLSGMEWLGIEIDEARNRAGETIVSSPRSRVLALVLRSDEEGTIARHTARLAGIDGRRTVQREAAHSATWIEP